MIALASLMLVRAQLAAPKDPKWEARKHLQKAVDHAVRYRFEKMLEEARKAQRWDPSIADSYAYIGLYFYRVGQLRSAEEEFRNSIEKNPNLSLPHIYLGNLLFDKGDLERALDEWRVGVRLDRSNPEGLASLALGLYLSGSTTEAIQHFKRALSLDRRYHDLQFLRDQEKGAAWTEKRVESVAPLLRLIEPPRFPY